MHLPGHGIRAQQDNAGDWEHVLWDGLHSGRVVVDDALSVDSVQSYAPFGTPLEPGAFGSPFMFTGEPLDENGLVYLRARYYVPELGAFPSLDPVEGTARQPMSLNRYGYVQAKAVNCVDLSGMILEKPWDGCDNRFPQQETSQCFIGNTPVNATTFSIIYTAAYGEIRQGGSAALALSVAANINILRAGNSITNFGDRWGGVFEDVCGANGGLVLPNGTLNPDCNTLGYMLGTASGELSQEMGNNESLTSAGAAR